MQIHRPVRRLRALAIGALAVALAGCAASPFAARVTTFQQWPADAVGQTYQFGTSAQQTDTLEHQNYQDVMRASLGGIGLVEARPGQGAPRFTVSFDYHTAPFQTYAEVPTYYPRPYFGYGYYGRGAPWGWGGGMAFPFGGYPAYQPVPVTGYRNVLEVSIRDAARGNAEVYQARAVHQGGADSMPQAMPYLARTIFEDFPQNNGQTRTVRVPLQ